MLQLLVRTANITITLSASDSGGSNLNNARYNWNSVATASVGTTFTNGATINIPLEGDHILYLYADDNAGNSSTSSGSYKLDTSDPSVSVTGSSISWQSTLPAITVSTSDSISGVSGVKYAWDTDAASGTATSNGTNLASTYPGDGSHTLNLLATDNSGRTKTFSGTYKIDRGKPCYSRNSNNDHSDQLYKSKLELDSGSRYYFGHPKLSLQDYRFGDPSVDFNR